MDQSKEDNIKAAKCAADLMDRARFCLFVAYNETRGMDFESAAEAAITDIGDIAAASVETNRVKNVSDFGREFVPRFFARGVEVCNGGGQP